MIPRTRADEPCIVVIDGDPAWDEVVLGAHRLLRMDAASFVHGAVDSASRLIVNLASPGGLDALAAWSGRTALPACGCIALPGIEQVIGLRSVAVVGALRPADPVAVLLRRRRRRRPHVVAAGPNPGALLALRRVLSADGFGVSVAWDAVQTLDLCELVRPQAVVLDLAVPRGGHHAVVALALRGHPPDLVLVPAGDDARAFASAYARARRDHLPSRSTLLAQLFSPPRDFVSGRGGARL